MVLEGLDRLVHHPARVRHLDLGVHRHRRELVEGLLPESIDVFEVHRALPFSVMRAGIIADLSGARNTRPAANENGTIHE